MTDFSEIQWSRNGYSPAASLCCIFFLAPVKPAAADHVGYVLVRSDIHPSDLAELGECVDSDITTKGLLSQRAMPLVISMLPPSYLSHIFLAAAYSLLRVFHG